jgi:hypothetical protein
MEILLRRSDVLARKRRESYPPEQAGSMRTGAFSPKKPVSKLPRLSNREAHTQHLEGA